MFSIANNRKHFYQWDMEQKLVVKDASIDEVHFSNTTEDAALVCVVYTEDGARVVNVPNILLQDTLDIKVYGYCGGTYTKQEARFKVIERSKPADYVYTETDLKQPVFNDKSNKAISANTAAFGADNIAGCKGYYIAGINKATTNAGYVFLSKEKVEKPFFIEGQMNEEAIDACTDNSFSDEPYKVGNHFNIINYRHYPLVAKIESHNKNVIRYYGVLPFSEMVEADSQYNWTFCVPKEPLKGVIDVLHGAFVIGEDNIAAGEDSFAGGKGNLAADSFATAIGRDNQAGYASLATGRATKALGERSFTSGKGTKAYSNDQVAIGTYNEIDAANKYAFIIGKGTDDNNPANAFTVDKAGNIVSNGVEVTKTLLGGTQGINVGATYANSSGVALGEVFGDYNSNKAVGSKSIAHGKQTETYGEYSRAGGFNTFSVGKYSVAEGYSTVKPKDVDSNIHTLSNEAIADKWSRNSFMLAKGEASFACGKDNLALGNRSHAEGGLNIAYGNNTHIEGYQNISSTTLGTQHIQGKYNSTENIDDKVHIVGWGSSTERKNIHTLDIDGNAWFAGDVEAQGIILLSPNKIKYLITVDNSGNLKTSKL